VIFVFPCWIDCLMYCWGLVDEREFMISCFEVVIMMSGFLCGVSMVLMLLFISEWNFCSWMLKLIIAGSPVRRFLWSL